MLAKPYTMRATLMMRDARLREYSCTDNNLDPKVYDKLVTNPSLFIRNADAAEGNGGNR